MWDITDPLASGLDALDKPPSLLGISRLLGNEPVDVRQVAERFFAPDDRHTAHNLARLYRLPCKAANLSYASAIDTSGRSSARDP